MKGLYLHLPFCAQKCHYCNFVITLDRRSEYRVRFFSAFEKEIKRASASYGRIRFDTFYLGGGTPSLLSIEEMERLIEVIRQSFDFAEGYEFTCEMNPGDADEAQVRAFRRLGINRVSLGVQAFQDELLKTTGRLHRVQNTYETIGLLQKYGITNLCFDLIAGLPGQTLEDFKESLRQARELGASQVSYYDLEIHEDTHWGVRQKKGEIDYQSEENRAAFYQAAIDFLTSSGYEQYEISTFAKLGFESRHNLIYWHNQEYLGLGPGAYSYLDGIRFQFAKNVTQYMQKCETNDWKPEVEDRLTQEQKETETLLTGLRLKQGISLGDFPIIRPRLELKIRQLLEGKMLLRQGDRLMLAPQGRSVVESLYQFITSA